MHSFASFATDNRVFPSQHFSNILKDRHTKMLSSRSSILNIVCTSHMFVSSSSDLNCGGCVFRTISSYNIIYITIQLKCQNSCYMVCLRKQQITSWRTWMCWTLWGQVGGWLFLVPQVLNTQSCLSVPPSVCLSVFPSIHISVRTSVCLSQIYKLQNSCSTWSSNIINTWTL